MLDGDLSVTIQGVPHSLRKGGFAYVPAGTEWSLRNRADEPARFLWLRKEYEPLEGYRPSPVVNHEQDVPSVINPTCESKWST